MLAEHRSTIVCANVSLSNAFGDAFGVAIPAVSFIDSQFGLRYFWHLLDEAKLVIFTGGEDINPAIYRQKNTQSTFSPLRDMAEIEVLRRSLALGKKILGVCRGHQLINAWLGGELVQDLATDLNVVHGMNHPLEYLNGGGTIGSIYQGYVNSIHHQGVVKPGEGLTPTTYWQGVYESTEGDNILTVQFHPEWMYNHDSTSKVTLWEYLNVWAKLGLGATL